MTDRARPARDAFGFSLRGMRTISSFTAAPAIADDRLHRCESSEKQPSGNRILSLWPRQRRTAPEGGT